MGYQRQEFRDEFRQKIFNDLERQPELQRSIHRRLPESFIEYWAIDEEVNSYLFPILRPGPMDERWYQFYLNGVAYQVAIPDRRYTEGVVAAVLNWCRSTPLPPEVLSSLQRAFDVYGALGYGPDTAWGVGGERVRLLSIQGRRSA